MAAKRYYWLKLKEDFFEDDTIQYIEEQPNGILYSNFYLKLCLKSLKGGGKLIRVVGDTLIPYDAMALAKLTGVPVDTVRCAMALFNKIGLVSELDTGELFLQQINELVGTETDKAASMRRLRAKKDGAGNNVTPVLPERYPDIDREKERELEKETRGREKSEKAPPAPPQPLLMTYGLSENVLMTREQYDQLQKRFPLEWDRALEKLSAYMARTGKNYSSHFETICKWIMEDRQWEQKQGGFSESLDMIAQIQARKGGQA